LWVCVLCVDKLDLVERICVISIVERDFLDMDVCLGSSSFQACVCVCGV